MRTLFRITSLLVLAVILFVPFIGVNAQFISDECDQSNPNLEDCIIANTVEVGSFFGNPNVNLPEFIGNLIKFALTLIASIFMLLILYAGFQWMTAGGNTDQVKKASQTIRNSVIGLIIIVLAYAITVTVFDVILGASGSLGGGASGGT